VATTLFDDVFVLLPFVVVDDLLVCRGCVLLFFDDTRFCGEDGTLEFGNGLVIAAGGGGGRLGGMYERLPNANKKKDEIFEDLLFFLFTIVIIMVEIISPFDFIRWIRCCRSFFRG